MTTSTAKIRAIRRNALRSTGARSSAGKAIAARNARRHGLTLPVLDERSLALDAVELARAIERSVTDREADAAGHPRIRRRCRPHARRCRPDARPRKTNPTEKRQ